MTNTPEVHQVYISIRPVSRAEPTGLNAYGFYVIADGVVTMTDAKGNPATDDTGKTYTAKLGPGDNAHETAGQLTKKLRDALRGKNAPPTGFSAPLNYPKIGVA